MRTSVGLAAVVLGGLAEAGAFAPATGPALFAPALRPARAARTTPQVRRRLSYFLFLVRRPPVGGAGAGSRATVAATGSPGLPFSSFCICGMELTGCRLGMQLKMGLFDAFKNALANDETLGAPPPDGLSQDPWLNGMRKSIAIKFVKDGEVVGEWDALPGDRLKDVASNAKVTLPETCMMKANDADVQLSSDTARIPSPQRRNLVTDGESGEPGDMMDSGLSAPVWTNFSQRGEVRTVKVEKTEYFVYL